MRPASSPAARTYGGLALVLALLWLALLSSRPLFNPDEGRYAEIPREMLAGGDWVIPHLNGVAYVEKPPLQYWATAASYAVLGPNVFAARLYPALCAFGTLFCVWVLAKGLWGAAAAWRAGAVLAGMLMFVVLGQHVTLDMGLTFYMTLGLTGFLLAQPTGAMEARGVGGAHGPGRATRGVPPVPAARRWMWLAWVATALGVLSKGPVAALIPAAVLVSYSLWMRDAGPWRRLAPGWGLPLSLVVAVPWHWLAARRQPEFLQFFFVHEHLSRYLTPGADREAPWWFFGAVFAVGSMPWTVSAVRVLWPQRRPAWGGSAARVAGVAFDPRVFLWIWVWFVGIFFSLSDSKLIPYLLPAMPAVALLVGALRPDTLRRDVAWTAGFTVAAGAAATAAAFVAPHVVAPSERSGYFLLLAGPLVPIGALLGVTGGFVLLRCRHDVTRAVVFVGAGWCLSGVLLMRAAAAVAPVYSGIALAQALREVPTSTPIYSVATYDQTLPFYWRRTVALVAYRGELDFGLRFDPDAEIAAEPEFLARWDAMAEQGYAVLERNLFDDFERRGVPMREVGRDLHRVLVARH